MRPTSSSATTLWAATPVCLQDHRPGRGTCRSYLDELGAKVEAEPLITVHLGTVIKDVEGFVGNFKTTLIGDSGEEAGGARRGPDLHRGG